MSVRLYMDEQVHLAITTGLRVRGVDVLTAQEDGRSNTPDDVVLDRATELPGGDLIRPGLRLPGG